MLNEDVPLPKPEKMTLGHITSELELRGLSTTGSRSELNRRLTQDDLSNFFSLYVSIKCIIFSPKNLYRQTRLTKTFKHESTYLASIYFLFKVQSSFDADIFTIFRRKSNTRLK